MSAIRSEIGDGTAFTACISLCTPALNDVWVLKNASGAAPSGWQQLLPAGPLQPQREVATAVYNSTSNTMTIYGGDSGFPRGTFSDVWVLTHANALGGTPRSTQLYPSGGPPTGTRKRWHSAVYDPFNNVMTVFGGYDNNDIITNEVWTLTHVNGIGGTPVWTKLEPDYGDCPARAAHKAVYDPVANTMTIFGGGNSGGFSNDTWMLWNARLGGSQGWIQLIPTGTLPVPGGWPTMVLDSANNRVIMFGGDAVEGYVFTTWIMTHGNGM